MIIQDESGKNQDELLFKYRHWYYWA